MLKILKKNKQEKELREKPVKKKLSKQQITTIVALSLLVLTHIAVLLAIILSFRYYSIYPSLFGSIVAIVVCMMIIVDIVFFVGFNHQDLALKIISGVLSIMLLIGGTVGTYVVAKANGIVDNVLDGAQQKYETYSGVFVSFNKYNSFKSIDELAGKNVGFLKEKTNGISYIAKGMLDEAKLDYGAVEYNTNAEMVQALIDGDIDAMVITLAYRDIYSLERDENSPFAKYLDAFVDFLPFEKELKIDSNRKAKNVSTDPFNVLLIGYSRTDIGSPVGLADSIILATINPQTYEVSMMSIARDSFVPIPCYGDEYDKINSGRSTSRACFIETVENFINTGRSEADHIDIDYYMELDYYGLVLIVDAIGGINVDNPVDFELDGTFVPAGKDVFCDGIMALQFCRERHHMPNGDFDRQQHQKEVIIKIARKFIESGDVSLALKAMDRAAEYMSTDLTLNQLTTIFNLLLNTKNNTSLNTFDLVDFQTLRMTGDGGIKYYSMSMHLPLWVYLIYQGSFDESMQHVNEVMGNYKSIKQEPSFSFSLKQKYEAPALYSLKYPDVFMFTPDPMPAYWADLEGLTLAEAMAWATEKGVKITDVQYITIADPNYNPELEGLICGQTVRYGSLVSEYPTGGITIMGTGEIDESKVVPNFVGHSYSKAVNWAEEYGVPYSIDFDTDVSGEVGTVVKQIPDPFTDIDECEELIIVVKAGEFTISFDKNGHGGSVPGNISVVTGDRTQSFENMSSVTESGTEYLFDGWYTAKDGGTKVTSTADVSGSDGSTITLYAHWTKNITITLDLDGGTCEGKTSLKPSDTLPTPTKDGYVFKGWFDNNGKQITDLSKLDTSITLKAKWEECRHDFGDPVVIEATCGEDGKSTKTCKKCGHVEETTIPATGIHTEETVEGYAATCGEDGLSDGKKCSVCGTILVQQEVIKATGEHSFGEWYDVEGGREHECSVCHKKEFEE